MEELNWWRVIYPEIGCKKNLENGWELNPCFQSPVQSTLIFPQKSKIKTLLG